MVIQIIIQTSVIPNCIFLLLESIPNQSEIWCKPGQPSIGLNTTEVICEDPVSQVLGSVS